MRFERMQHRVALCGRYFVLVITADSTFICQKSAVSLLWGHVIWVNFLVDIIKTINVSVNGACIPLAVQDRIDMVVTLSTG